MEEPASPIRFDQTPDTCFYMCRSCRNHVLSSENDIFKVVFLDTIIGQNAVNIRADDAEPRWLLFDLQVVNVSCKLCSRDLGQKVVMVEEPDQLFQEGRFIFFLDQMLYWDGKQVVFADTEQPVEDTGSQEGKSTEEIKEEKSTEEIEEGKSTEEIEEEKSTEEEGKSREEIKEGKSTEEIKEGKSTEEIKEGKSEEIKEGKSTEEIKEG